MDAIEKRARELLAAEYRKAGANPAACELMAGRASWPNQMALNAIIAALTTPDGYVLVPVEPTAEMISAAWRYGDGDEAPDPVYAYRTMLAVRPEVP